MHTYLKVQHTYINIYIVLMQHLTNYVINWGGGGCNHSEKE